jgi:hypothetical protein
MQGIPSPFSCNVPHSLNDWLTEVVVEHSERNNYLPGTND